ncbi:MAG: tyrosine-type recombinase/integrase [Bacteriovoracaceae bacterium]|nr:tyrosine-type recombinase/integrase [Bacteriovoracaceae bacterium]
MAKKTKIRIKEMIQGIKFNEVFDNQKDAETFRGLLDALKTGRLPANQHQKQISLAKSWCAAYDEKREDGQDKGSLASFMKPVRLFQHLMKRNVMDITTDEFIEVYSTATNERTGGPLAVGTLERYVLILKQVLEKAVELGAVGINVKKLNKKLVKVARSMGLPEKEYTAFTPEEVTQWMASEEKDDAWVRLYVRFSLASFKRIGEILAIGWADVDFADRKILINKMITGGRFKWGLKNGRPAHHVKMDDELYEVLQKLKKYQKDNDIESDWVFSQGCSHELKQFPLDQKCPYRNKPVSRQTVCNRVHADIIRAGLAPKKMHDLRRTAASNFFISSPLTYKETMLILQVKLHHASLTSTEKYVSVSHDYLSNKMDEANNARTIRELEEKAQILELQLKIQNLEAQTRVAA